MQGTPGSEEKVLTYGADLGGGAFIVGYLGPNFTKRELTSGSRERPWSGWVYTCRTKL